MTVMTISIALLLAALGCGALVWTKRRREQRHQVDITYRRIRGERLKPDRRRHDADH